MKARFISVLTASTLAVTLFTTPGRAAQQTGSTGDDVGSFVGSIFLSILHVPLKLATCVGTQAVSAVAYTATYGVAGNYEGGTNGRQIGEVATRACGGAWFISPEQVNRDYQ
jgi:hypothetical protein